VRVSTVFLVMNHNHFGGPPILFETMVFGGPMDQEQRRCSTWAEAEAQHWEVVENAIPKPVVKPVAPSMKRGKRGIDI
jgi:hypothetical protein